MSFSFWRSWGESNDSSLRSFFPKKVAPVPDVLELGRFKCPIRIRWIVPNVGSDASLVRLSRTLSRSSSRPVHSVHTHSQTSNGRILESRQALAEEIRALARSVKHTQIYACRTGDRAQQGVAVASTHAEEEEEDDELDHSAIKKGHASEKSRVIAHTARVAASDEGVAEAKSMDEEDEAAYEGAEVSHWPASQRRLVSDLVSRVSIWFLGNSARLSSVAREGDQRRLLWNAVRGTRALE